LVQPCAIRANKATMARQRLIDIPKRIIGGSCQRA
jgi:hypothetical protein